MHNINISPSGPQINEYVEFLDTTTQTHPIHMAASTWGSTQLIGEEFLKIGAAVLFVRYGSSNSLVSRPRYAFQVIQMPPQHRPPNICTHR